ncbi:twin-arginine translocation pathway signal protein [Roseomonas sp. OT10]|uniref:Bug family tripartite tricarboxylate transporter substrate binding protein n=1 Tax=Roseomonas cutis TaxID=2897332 RepID=UPI001E3C849B|nr:tripartite tricarboxylate transporter substrate-binding protein [Roseomonas sp. OT10]UFN49471.1 twin-arginine translocation pathway signal protein [Roseomonas sp. OT10]
MTSLPPRVPIGRRALAGLLAAPALAAPALAPGLARAQGAWPDRPIRLIVPFAPGGATDSSARAMSDRLSAVLGQTVVVENRSGAGGSIGAGVAAQARPDGATFLLDTIVQVVNPLVLRGLPFDYRTAFTPVMQVTRLPLALAVRADFPAQNLAEFVAEAKRRPGQISCGNAGNATAAHLAAALLQSRAGIELNNLPYRGGGDAGRDIAGGTLDSGMLTLVSLVALVQGGRARFLAVASPQRTSLLPDVPTLAESYPGTALDEWTGLFAPAGTPAPILEKLQAAVVKVLAEPEIRHRLAQIGAEPVGSSPEEFARFLAESRQQAEMLVREAKIEPS